MRTITAITEKGKVVRNESMKAYTCDICEIAITDPYTAKMKEFYWACDYENDGIYPAKAKRKQKLHLCGNCFEGLKGIFAKHSADAKYIVHCKGCKFLNKDGVCFRNIQGIGYKKPKADDFCSYGERKERHGKKRI